MTVPDFNTVPWLGGEVIDLMFLAMCCFVTGSVPLIYVYQANLRDPLARAVFAGMCATTVVFQVTLVATVAFHAGWTPSVDFLHWLTRAVYLTVSIGEFTFLLGLLGAIRERRARRLWDRDVV
jgi:hypothetical protein